MNYSDSATLPLRKRAELVVACMKFDSSSSKSRDDALRETEKMLKEGSKRAEKEHCNC